MRRRIRGLLTGRKARRRAMYLERSDRRLIAWAHGVDADRAEALAMFLRRRDGLPAQAAWDTAIKHLMAERRAMDSGAWVRPMRRA